MSKRNIIFIIACVIIFGGVIINRSIKTQAHAKEQNKKQVKNVKVVSVQDGYRNTIAYRGIVKGATEVHLAPKAQGRVTKIYKEIGETVYKGQLLATIDGSELWAQTNVAQTGYKSAKESTEKTKKYFDKQVSQAKKGRNLAQSAYEVAKQSGNQQAIIQAKANYEMAKKAVSVAKKGRDLQVEMAKGQKEVAKSQLIATQTMASNTQLRAPFSGVLAQSNVEVGSLVSPQISMFLLVGNAGQEVEISVPALELDNLSVGQEVEVITDNDKKIKAKISAISPMIDTHTRKGIVKVSITKSESLVLGEYVSVLLPEKKVADEAVIPRNALVQEYHDSFVFIVVDNKIHKQLVRIRQDFGDKVVIEGGLNIGDNIVIEGQQYLDDNDFVEITE